MLARGAAPSVLVVVPSRVHVNVEPRQGELMAGLVLHPHGHLVRVLQG